MADIFISYKRDERSAIEQIASSLRALGLTVWFDAGLSAGETFNSEIDREARGAKAILVCWSPAARQSKWVIAEAMIGFEQDKLAAIHVAGPDGLSLPTPFNTVHAEDLRAWITAPSETHAGWRSVLRRIGTLCRRTDIESWGRLDTQATNSELRAWVAANEGSPLLVVADGLLRARMEQQQERERQDQVARDTFSREEAERRAREDEARAWLKQAKEKADRLAREGVEQLLQEEAARLAREEAERLAREEQERHAPTREMQAVHAASSELANLPRDGSSHLEDSERPAISYWRARFEGLFQSSSRLRAFFDRLAPERQIYHRSGGTVRSVSLSPLKQFFLLVAAVGLLAALIVVTLDHWGDASTQATYDRWLNERRFQAAASQAPLDERTRQFERATVDIEGRQEVLRSLLEFAGGASLQLPASRPIERDGARVMMAPSIDEAEPRQSRVLAAALHQATRGGFRARADQLEADQERTLSELEDQVVERSEQVRGVLRMTDVSMASLTGTAAQAAGGPLVPQDFVAYLRDSGLNPAFAERVTQVAARVTEWRHLVDIANATPLARPVAVDYRETSGYGRIDLADCGIDLDDGFHSGLDMAASERAPVVAAAAGVVVFAGARSGYGDTVEIDHGHGFKTRYATLSDIQVQNGDLVAIGQRIGSMGSTGRSTATHLHYEVWFRGRAVDPVKFLRAGRHVHEQG